MPLDRITLICCAAGYATALLLEWFQLLWPRPVPRLAATLFMAAGLAAHSVFLVMQHPPISSQFGSLLFLAWILAVFGLYGSIHHARLAWGIFVLPVVLGLTLLAALFARPDSNEIPWLGSTSIRGEAFWGVIHGSLLLLAAVGVCVAFVASVMYLVQAKRLRAKVIPGHGMRLLSLERLELMNRRAIIWAFPLLTAGVLVGLVLMLQDSEPFRGWTDPKVLGATVLWLVFAILLILRYGARLRGRRLAQLTIVAFVLLVLTLASAHTSVPGGGP